MMLAVPTIDARAPSSDDRVAGSPEVPEFRVDVHRVHGDVRIRPVGEVDLATAPAVCVPIDEALAAGARRVVLDLRATTFMDSTGLQLALRTAWRAGRNGTEFALVAGPPAVQRVFEITGLRERLRFVDAPQD